MTGDPQTVIRQALEAVYSGHEGTQSYFLPDDKRTAALAALDRLTAERDTLLSDIGLYRIAHQDAEALRERAVAAEAQRDEAHKMLRVFIERPGNWYVEGEIEARARARSLLAAAAQEDEQGQDSTSGGTA